MATWPVSSVPSSFAQISPFKWWWSYLKLQSPLLICKSICFSPISPQLEDKQGQGYLFYSLMYSKYLEHCMRHSRCSLLFVERMNVLFSGEQSWASFEDWFVNELPNVYIKGKRFPQKLFSYVGYDLLPTILFKKLTN